MAYDVIPEGGCSCDLHTGSPGTCSCNALDLPQAELQEIVIETQRAVDVAGGDYTKADFARRDSMISAGTARMGAERRKNFKFDSVTEESTMSKKESLATLNKLGYAPETIFGGSRLDSKSEDYLSELARIKQIAADEAVRNKRFVTDHSEHVTHEDETRDDGDDDYKNSAAYRNQQRGAVRERAYTNLMRGRKDLTTPHSDEIEDECQRLIAAGKATMPPAPQKMHSGADVKPRHDRAPHPIANRFIAPKSNPRTGGGNS